MISLNFSTIKKYHNPDEFVMSFSVLEILIEGLLFYLGWKGGGGGVNSHIKWTGVVVVPFRGLKSGFGNC